MTCLSFLVIKINMKERNEKKGSVLHTALAATDRMLLTGVEIIKERKANIEKVQW